MIISYCLTAVSDNTSSQVVDRVGMILFAVYQVAVTIVLVNMLIAMMSHSFEAIQVRPLIAQFSVSDLTKRTIPMT